MVVARGLADIWYSKSWEISRSLQKCFFSYCFSSTRLLLSCCCTVVIAFHMAARALICSCSVGDRVLLAGYFSVLNGCWGVYGVCPKFAKHL